MSELLTQLQNEFPEYNFKENHLLAPYTTVKIGGPAEAFYEAKDQDKLIKLLSFVKKNKLPLTMIGWGANILISDKGVKGLVIRNVAGEIKVLDDNNPDKGEANLTKLDNEQASEIESRWNADSSMGTFKYDFKDLNYDETDKDRVLVEIDAGVSLNQAIVMLINQGITGLQWYARIPSTIGGAVYNNIHGGTHFLSEVIESVTVMDENGEVRELSKDEINLGYDQSRFHHSNETILSAKFNLFKGDTDKAKYVVKEWSKRKSIQPSNSLGCTFKNISNEEKEKLGYPTTSVGYIVEHVLGMKGFKIGEATVSEYHCAFIENKGQATAEDYLNVIKTIIKEAKLKTGLVIVPEIFFLGFDKSELEGIVS
ncbi:MAG: FAD-binding protein [Candidatus Pacebacteria bacterium]|nr:FAD-binding protein [Candidatus Paceibacterota bacterium]